MRDFINIISEHTNGDTAEVIYDTFSPLERYRLHDRLPYCRDKALRRDQAISYIADHLGEFGG